MGCQDLLEEVPGRSRRDKDITSSPTDLRTFMKGVTGRSSSKSYSIKDEVSNEIMAVIKLDNQPVAQTNWKPCSQQAWDQRFSIELDKSRELEIGIYWRDWRSLCAVKFLKLEEFIDDFRHGMALQLEPQGLLFAEVSVFFIFLLWKCLVYIFFGYIYFTWFYILGIINIYYFLQFSKFMEF